jgi:hypothetical protein
MFKMATVAIYARPDGTAGIIYPSPGAVAASGLTNQQFFLREARKSENDPAFTPARFAVVDSSTLPASRRFRAHWRLDAQNAVTYLLTGARQQLRDELAPEYKARLAAANEELERLADIGATAAQVQAVRSYRVQLRALPDLVRDQVALLTTAQQVEAYVVPYPPLPPSMQ